MALLSAKRIEPGQSSKIKINVKTDGQREIDKTVTVVSNDPTQPKSYIHLKATVEPEFLLSVNTVYFGNLSKGDKVEKEIIVDVIRPQKVRITSVDSTDPSVKARLDPLPGQGGGKMRVVLSHTALKRGLHFGLIRIHTSSRYRPIIDIPVRGGVK